MVKLFYGRQEKQNSGCLWRVGGQGMTEKGFEGTFWSVDNLYHDAGLGNICQHSSNGTKVSAFH